MHNIDQMRNGEVIGWVEGDRSGCPSKVCVHHVSNTVSVFATQPREDVLQAGFTRFSGFHLNISSSYDDKQCEVEVESERYLTSPVFDDDANLIRIDSASSSELFGWVNLPEGLFSLVFHSATGPSRAELHVRSDINALFASPPERLYGFYARDVDMKSVFAVCANGARMHWFSPNSFATRFPSLAFAEQRIRFPLNA